VIWLNPAAWIAIAVTAVPVLIHLLVHRRAERFPFPTLRFIQPTRLAAIRRRVLEEIPLLAVRLAIVAAAVAAFAGPLVITSTRRSEWNGRVVRAIVIDARTDVAPPVQREDTAFRTERFRAQSLSDGIRRAIAWLDTAPPARREVVITGPLTIGSIVDADLAAVPATIGIKFERIGAPPQERSVATTPLLEPEGTVRRMVTLSGPRTSVSDARADAVTPWPIEVVATPDARPTIQAAIEAVTSQHVRMVPSDHPLRLLLVDQAGRTPATSEASPLRLPWMSDAVARIARDADLQTEAARVPTGFADPRFSAPPWQPIAAGADGRPLISAAEASGTLVIASAANAGALLTPLLLRSLANNTAAPDAAMQAEVLPIADGQLRAWTRPPAAVAAPRLETVERDDRRWLWVGVLALLGVEAWMRRARRDAVDTIDQETARVA
jgi:hypothetical protein